MRRQEAWGSAPPQAGAAESPTGGGSGAMAGARDHPAWRRRGSREASILVGDEPAWPYS